VIFVQLVYFHHLLQDVNMPAWAMVTGQIISYASGIPLIAITVFSLAVYVKGSGLKWDLASRLLVLSVIGWGIGSIPATIDGMIAVNKVMHNTQWVPGHFHIYLLLGEVAMAFGFCAWLVRDEAHAPSRLDRFAFLAYVIGGSSIPRRWAVHYEEWQFQSQIGTLFGAIIVLATLLIVLRYIAGLLRGNAKG